MRTVHLKLAAFSLLFLLLAVYTLGQQARAAQDAFQDRAGGLTLDGQTIIDALARLSQTTRPAYSVEFPLGKTIAEAAPPVKRIMAGVDSGVIPEILDHLCELDRTFTWKRIGNTANIFPRILEGDPSYLLNRLVAVVTFSDVPDAEKAVFEAVAQLPGPKEQIAVLQTGTSLTFVKPWTATFRNITIREIFDQIAQQFGPTYGWQFGGAADFRVITFHERLSAKPVHTTQ
jgi:hypothetical protein